MRGTMTTADNSIADSPAASVTANADASRFAETWPTGDADAFARVFARILVRRALNDEGTIPDEDCQNQRLAG